VTLTLKINRVPDSLKDQVCTKFGQNPLKDVDSTLECSQGCYGRTDGSVTISLRNFVGEGIIIGKSKKYNGLKTNNGP
jgi:hypothetical protein